MRFFIWTLLFLSISFKFFSQNDSLLFKKRKTSQWYFSWGYTRALYTKSTIHFKDESQVYHEYTGKAANYDFTIYDVKASDKPDFKNLPDVINVTIPQYVFRIGYSINERWGIELNYDHTKYVVNDWQKVRIKGQIDDHLINGDTVLDPNNFLHFEHTDGANFWMINAVRRWEFFKPSKNFSFSYVLKPGGGLVIPRTDVTIFGERLNNDWHVAGWIVGVENGLRMEFFRHGFMEFVAKGTYADYRKVLILGKGNGNANHHFFTAQLTLTAGLRFGQATK